jgi:hypothetical protein
MKGIQNKNVYIGNYVSYTYPVYVIGKENSESIFYARLMRMRRHISATMLRITWTERSWEIDRQRWTNRLAS